MYGQELNPESYAICKADMLIKGQDIANIIFGNTLSNDGLLVRRRSFEGIDARRFRSRQNEGTSGS